VIHMLEKLKSNLKSVSDYYDDFYLGIIDRCESNAELTEHILNFMEDNPDANTSEILIDMMYFIGLPYCDDNGVWHSKGKIITEEEAVRISEADFCDD